MTRKRLAIRSIVSCVALAILCFVGLYAYFGHKRAHLRSAFMTVQLGDTKERVVELLGQPNSHIQPVDQPIVQSWILSLLYDESRERWLYDDWRVTGLFQSADTYVIEFDEYDGRVAGLRWPE